MELRFLFIHLVSGSADERSSARANGWPHCRIDLALHSLGATTLASNAHSLGHQNGPQCSYQAELVAIQSHIRLRRDLLW